MVTSTMTAPLKEILMSAVRRLVATSFAVATVAGLAAVAPVVAPAAASGTGTGTGTSTSTSTVVAIGPGCCK